MPGSIHSGVYQFGVYQGWDPDPSIRFQLSRRTARSRLSFCIIIVARPSPASAGLCLRAWSARGNDPASWSGSVKECTGAALYETCWEARATSNSACRAAALHLRVQGEALIDTGACAAGWQGEGTVTASRGRKG